MRALMVRSFSTPEHLRIAQCDIRTTVIVPAPASLEHDGYVSTMFRHACDHVLIPSRLECALECTILSSASSHTKTHFMQKVRVCSSEPMVEEFNRRQQVEHGSFPCSFALRPRRTHWYAVLSFMFYVLLISRVAETSH